MKKIIFVISMLLTVGLLGACSSDENNQPFRVRNFSNSGCKPATRVGEEGEILPNNEAIVVKDMEDGYLSINHENAMFNCETRLNIQATIEGNVIKVIETFDAVGTNCTCPYDLYCEVGPLADGDYTIIIYKDATFDQADAEEYTRFSHTVSHTVTGTL